MKILLLGEYSNVHATLRNALTLLGHDVTLISNGDFWKDYPRDIDLSRTPGRWGGICYTARLLTLFPHLRGYDVVQLINPMFLEIKAERIMPIYRYLRRHNKKVFLGAFGMDYYWVKGCCQLKPLAYSDFNIGSQLRTDAIAAAYRKEWEDTPKAQLNQEIAATCNGIIAGLYEYWTCYHPFFAEKTTYIPFPIDHTTIHSTEKAKHSAPIQVFIGINKTRNEYKGTDIMLKALTDLYHKYPTLFTIQKAESIPFAQYRQMMSKADILLDQLYSYTPSMNTLEAMSQGIVCVGGGEEDFYHFIGEEKLRPIINVKPTYNDVYTQLEHIILHSEKLQNLSAQSQAFVYKHHDHINVAKQYLQFWTEK